MTTANDEDPAGRLRALCLALPEAVEKETWYAPTYRVREKIFAMERSRDGRVSLWCKAPPGSQAILVGADPERFFAPPYVGPKGWIGMRLDRDPDWAEVAFIVTRSYRMTAPKRLVARLPQADRQDTVEDGNSPDCDETLGASPRR